MNFAFKTSETSVYFTVEEMVPIAALRENFAVEVSANAAEANTQCQQHLLLAAQPKSCQQHEGVSVFSRMDIKYKRSKSMTLSKLSAQILHFYVLQAFCK